MSKQEGHKASLPQRSVQRRAAPPGESDNLQRYKPEEVATSACLDAISSYEKSSFDRMARMAPDVSTRQPRAASVAWFLVASSMFKAVVVISLSYVAFSPGTLRLPEVRKFKFAATSVASHVKVDVRSFEILSDDSGSLETHLGRTQSLTKDR